MDDESTIINSMTEFRPRPGQFELPLTRDEEKGARAAEDYLRASAGEHLTMEQLTELAASVMNIHLARQLGILPLEIQTRLEEAADSIYNLPNT